jgi:2-hydroxy-3-keto-5-methylthiopentenyl-1-phosphate phosphatase
MSKKPVIALMYDFDKTLCTNDMQNYSFIPSLGIPTDDFWDEVNKFSKANGMDGLLCYMYMMLKKAGSRDIPIRREDFVKLGEKIEYFPGVEDWFGRINKYGEEKGVIIEHYVISSGLQEIIEGSAIYQNFKKTYACEFLYDINGVATWPKNVVNFTTKTQFLFRINKGELDISEDKKLNTYTPMEERRIPFRNMIYIGDGMTDVPCMKLVKLNGGQSIAVFRRRNKKTAAKLLSEDRVNFITEANYSEGRELDTIVKTIIDKMSVVDRLSEMNLKHKRSIEGI